MSILEAVILGAIQGLTEFIPISSSGHLVIFQHLLGVQEAPLTFDVLLHLGTLLAVFAAFWTDIVSILKKPFSRITYLLVVGCVPAAVIGFVLAPLFEKAFESLLIVGLGLICTGFFLKVGEWFAGQRVGLKFSEEMTYGDALGIGFLQALAIVPGISRSGSTIAAGLIAGLDREFAARFSFLLSIPVIIGAGVFELQDAVSSGIAASLVMPYACGFVTAALFGYLAIILVLKLVRQGRLAIFSYYCWGLAMLTLLAHFMG